MAAPEPCVLSPNATSVLCPHIQDTEHGDQSQLHMQCSLIHVPNAGDSFGPESVCDLLLAMPHPAKRSTMPATSASVARMTRSSM